MKKIQKKIIYIYIYIGVVSITQLIKVTDSAVLGGVAEVMSSNPRWVIKCISAFTGIVDL